MTVRRAQPPIKVSLGRERVTRVVSPSEAGYIVSMRQQVGALVANMVKTIEHIENYTPEAILFGLEPVYIESQRLVPVDTGALKRSGFTEIRKGKTQSRVVLGYGKYGHPHYAAMVHERLDFRHQEPTQAKFLENAIATKAGDFRRRVELYMSRLVPADG